MNSDQPSIISFKLTTIILSFILLFALYLYLTNDTIYDEVSSTFMNTPRTLIARFNDEKIKGNVIFTEDLYSKKSIIRVNLTDFSHTESNTNHDHNTKYKINVHEYGLISNDCSTIGKIFDINKENINSRHKPIGDLGIVSLSIDSSHNDSSRNNDSNHNNGSHNNTINSTIITKLPLRGVNSIVGRSIAISKINTDSRTNNNLSKDEVSDNEILACAVIVHSEV